MSNLMTINGQQAVISFDPDINLFRGGGACERRRGFLRRR
jgi:predicted HicB family RNase H-like nuclease